MNQRHSTTGTDPGTASERQTAARHAGRAPAHVAAELAAALQASGPLEALRVLNARTRFRFTGIYHAEPPFLRNLHLFDRENPRVNVSGDVVRLEETYCGITCGGGVPFTTPDAPNDPRLLAHAARESVLSYGGVPIRFPGDGATVWGTLCHFDVRPRLLPSEELDVLEAAAPVFARWMTDHHDAAR